MNNYHKFMRKGGVHFSGSAPEENHNAKATSGSGVSLGSAPKWVFSRLTQKSAHFQHTASTPTGGIHFSGAAPTEHDVSDALDMAAKLVHNIGGSGPGLVKMDV